MKETQQFGPNAEKGKRSTKLDLYLVGRRWCAGDELEWRVLVLLEMQCDF